MDVSLLSVRLDTGSRLVIAVRPIIRLLPGVIIVAIYAGALYRGQPPLESIAATPVSVHAIAAVLALLAGYQERWVFDRDRNSVSRVVTVFGLGSRFQSRCTDIVAVTLLGLRRTGGRVYDRPAPGRPAGRRGGAGRHLVSLLVIHRDRRLQVETGRAWARPKLEALGRRIAAVCGAPFEITGHVVEVDAT